VSAAASAPARRAHSDGPKPAHGYGSAVRVVSAATRELLPQARVMLESLHRHHPDWSVEIVLLGAVAGDEAEADLPIVPIADELGVAPEQLLLYHSVDEMITLAIPRVLLRRCRDGVGPVIGLPATAWILSTLEPLAAPLRDRPVLLAPRVVMPPPGDGLEPTLQQLELTGRMATNVMAVDGSSSAVAFLNWWSERLEVILGSADGRRRGHPPAHHHWAYRSLELACTGLDTAVIDDPGANLSAWNLAEHHLREEGERVLVDDAWPLRLMDLAGFDPTRPYRLRPGSSRVRLSRDPVLKRLVIRYAELLTAAGWRDRTFRRHLGQRLANGLEFDATLQTLYATADALGAELPDPLTAEGTEALMNWLREPAVHGGRHGVNRYVLHRVIRQRRDVVTAFPDLDGSDGVGLVNWAHSSGQAEMEIPDALMPSRVSGPAGSDAAESTTEAVAVVGPEDAAAPAAPTAADGADLGVRISGYLGHILGLGAAARGYAEALGAAGVVVSTVTASLDHLRPTVELETTYGRHSYSDLVSGGGHAFELICVNPDELPDFVDRLGPGYLRGTRIGVWGWETTSIPKRWEPAFELVDEIWVYSEFVAKNLGAVAPVPVVPLPPPVQPPQAPGEPLRLGVPDGFLFLFAFDYSSTIQRKNPIGLIEAFKRAFAPGEGPQLLIKTINAPLLPLAEEELLWAVDGRPDVHVVDCSLSADERDALMAACDCYVSLHRSEGFGLTLAEAMSLGKPVIGTGYSGNVDFMTPDNSFLVDYEVTRVGPEVQIYPADGEWAEPSVAHAAELMRHVVADPAGAAAVGAQARADIVRTLSPATTGAAMRERLQALADHGRA
jgi:glycosyltransferase involved in cell wall biosynthesis